MVKKKDDSSWIVLVFFFAATLLALIYLLSSVFYLVAWVYFEIKGFALGKANSGADFDLSTEEKNELSGMKKEFTTLSQTIYQLKEKGSDLSIRKDGFFHARSKLGKELNSQLETIIPDKERYGRQINAMERIPQQRKNKWVFNNSMKNAFRIGSPVYVLTVIVFSRYYVPEWIPNMGVWIKENSIIEFFDMPSIYYGALLPSIGITLVFSSIIFFSSLMLYNRKFM